MQFSSFSFQKNDIIQNQLVKNHILFSGSLFDLEPKSMSYRKYSALRHHKFAVHDLRILKSKGFDSIIILDNLGQCCISISATNFSFSLLHFVYSPPLSDLSVCIFQPIYFWSLRCMYSFNFVNGSLILDNNYIMVNPVNASIRLMSHD